MSRWILAAVLMLTSQLALALDIQKDNLYPQVEFDTSMGKIVVELDRTRAPITVDNFLTYVVRGDYNNTLFHRIIADFVVQGGGLSPKYEELPSDKPIVNESGNGLSNSLGTIAMARENAPIRPPASFTSMWPTTKSSTHPPGAGAMPYSVKSAKDLKFCRIWRW